MTERNLPDKPSTESFLTPASFIRAAKAAHPAYRYALAVAGIAALVVTFAQFGVGYAALTFGTIALIGLMALFLVFAQAARLTKAKLDLPAQVFVWAILMISIAIILFLTVSAFFNWPLPFRDTIIRAVSPPATTVVAPPAEPAPTSAAAPAPAQGQAQDEVKPEPVAAPDPPIEEPAKTTAAPEITPQQKALIAADIRNAYKAVGWQLAAFDNWGAPPSRSTLRAKDRTLFVSFADGREVSMGVDPDQLPISQYYNANRDVIATLRADAAVKVADFFSAYEQYKAALTRLNASPANFLGAFTVTNLAARDAVMRGREALCALDQTPPRLFPNGGVMEPVPPSCSDSPFPPP
ncbi:MAG TPA: hypothetical protein VNZ85_15620 [Caulobacter sp.]|nr:hypothetical protein [Caulobacter sp.]